MGDAVLEARPKIERIRFSLPNKHHLLYDLSRSGLENDHEIFHATEDPHELIERNNGTREPHRRGGAVRAGRQAELTELTRVARWTTAVSVVTCRPRRSELTATSVEVAA